MRILTLEEWIEQSGEKYLCRITPSWIKPDREDCSCGNCFKARQDYQAAIAADKIRLAEFQRTHKPSPGD